MIMKKICKTLLLSMLLLVCNSCIAISNDEAVASFKAFTKTIIDNIAASQRRGDTVVVQDDTDKTKYKKIGHVDLAYTLDMKQNNSMMYPFIGYLYAKDRVIIYTTPSHPNGKFDSEAEAQKAMNPVYDRESISFLMRYSYLYDNGTWVLKETAAVTSEGTIPFGYVETPYLIHSVIKD